TSSAGVLDLRSWSLISRIGVVLWSNFERGDARWLFRKGDTKKEVRRSKRGWCRRGFKPDAAAGLNRNATTSACVGWDEPNIENHPVLRKDRRSKAGLRPAQGNGFTTTRMTTPIISTVGTSLIIR